MTLEKKIMLDYIKSRIKERTSWDGGVIIAGSLAIILFGGIVKIAAWAGLAYGIWAIVKNNGLRTRKRNKSSRTSN